MYVGMLMVLFLIVGFFWDGRGRINLTIKLIHFCFSFGSFWAIFHSIFTFTFFYFAVFLWLFTGGLLWQLKCRFDIGIKLFLFFMGFLSVTFFVIPSYEKHVDSKAKTRVEQRHEVQRR